MHRIYFDLILLLVVVGKSTSIALPSPATIISRLKPGDFNKSCHSFSLNAPIFTAICRTSGLFGRDVSSSINLDASLANHDGVLVWANDGKFSKSCQQCQMKVGSIFGCYCKNSKGSLNYTIKELNERISNNNGALQLTK